MIKRELSNIRPGHTPRTAAALCVDTSDKSNVWSGSLESDIAEIELYEPSESSNSDQRGFPKFQRPSQLLIRKLDNKKLQNNPADLGFGHVLIQKLFQTAYFDK